MVVYFALKFVFCIFPFGLPMQHKWRKMYLRKKKKKGKKGKKKEEEEREWMKENVNKSRTCRKGVSAIARDSSDYSDRLSKWQIEY